MTRGVAVISGHCLVIGNEVPLLFGRDSRRL
jgi:hypothetical protein